MTSELVADVGLGSRLPTLGSGGSSASFLLERGPTPGGPEEEGDSGSVCSCRLLPATSVHTSWAPTWPSSCRLVVTPSGCWASIGRQRSCVNSARSTSCWHIGHGSSPRNTSRCGGQRGRGPTSVQGAWDQALSKPALSSPTLQALLKTGEHSWSLAELIQALVLLTHCHSLASFVFGCGILPEGDPENGPGPQVPSPPSEQSSPPGRDALNSSGVSQGAWVWAGLASDPWKEPLLA